MKLGEIMSIEYSLKKKLDQIIDYAYRDFNDPKKERFTWFKLNVSKIKKRGYSGTYNIQTHEIIVYDVIGTKDGNNISTLLHEVSHHIDWVLHGKTGHQKEFYEVFSKLLYAAIDLNMVSLNELRNMDHRNRDYNKVQKILSKYSFIKSSVNKDCDEYVIKVLNAYSIKEDLKKMGYHWNSISKSWDKESIHQSILESEKKFLLDLNVSEENIVVLNNNKIHF